MGPKLTLAVCDFWPHHRPDRDPLLLALGRHAELGTERIAKADLVVYSVFGRRHEAVRRTAIAVSGEPVLPPTRYAQWTLDWRFRPSDHHLRLPYWAMQLLRFDSAALVPDAAAARIDLGERPARFCNFIYSNPSCEVRNAFFVALDARRRVDALGRVYRNAEDPRLSGRSDIAWGVSKREVLADYRFTIAFENEEHPGYTTEKMLDAWLAGSVPIYWGNPAVVADFPTGSYLSLYEAGSMAKLIEQVMEAEHDGERYLQLRRANPLLTGLLAEQAVEYAGRLDEFAGRVIADTAEHRGRRRPLYDLAARRPVQVGRGMVRSLRRSLALRLGR
ncbi:MAG: hypothetical protein RI900_758 [Actinomycetota bacterium]|jgi:hypothetical protein